MAFKMKGITPLKQKKKTAIEAIKEVNTQNLSKSEKEIYLAKIRGNYQDLTGDKLKKASYDDPTGTVVSKSPEGPMASGNYDPSEPAFKMKGHELPGIKQRKSPYKNYKNPQDYKVFNYGNKPTPVKKTDEPSPLNKTTRQERQLKRAKKKDRFMHGQEMSADHKDKTTRHGKKGGLTTLEGHSWSTGDKERKVKDPYGVSKGEGATQGKYYYKKNPLTGNIKLLGKEEFTAPDQAGKKADIKSPAKWKQKTPNRKSKLKVTNTKRKKVMGKTGAVSKRFKTKIKTTKKGVKTVTQTGTFGKRTKTKTAW